MSTVRRASPSAICSKNVGIPVVVSLLSATDVSASLSQTFEKAISEPFECWELWTHGKCSLDGTEASAPRAFSWMMGVRHVQLLEYGGRLPNKEESLKSPVPKYNKLQMKLTVCLYSQSMEAFVREHLRWRFLYAPWIPR